MDLDRFLDHRVYGNSARAWLVALAVAAAVYLVLALVQRWGIRRLEALAKRTATHLDDLFVALLYRTRGWFLLAVALHTATRTLRLPAGTRSTLVDLVALVAIVQGMVWANGAIAHFVAHHTRQREEAGEASSVTTIKALGIGARIFIWAMLFLAALDTVGFDVTALITGLGIGGIAIALAVQNILGDILAALSIVFDKPFVVGDTIAVDTMVGTVEHVGIKTTRVRSVGGEQIIFSNTDLLKSRVRNFKRMYERRVLFQTDVTYDTPAELVRRIPAILREVVETQHPVRFDRSHFSAYTDSALRFETVYYVLDPDYARHMDVQQAVFVALLERFRAEGIQFAFPTRTVLVDGGTPAARRASALTQPA